jgi:SAM-dependent methyltransferase
MLTVDYAKLGVRPGDRLLDLGCGFGRHAFEAARRGARVVACDMSDAELKEVRATFGAMAEAGQVAEEGCTGAVNGDAVHLPFTDAAFDRVIASEVMEHIPNDSGAMRELARVLRPGGTIAVTVPAWLPEKVCWMLSDEYHAPFVDGGHVRIYTEDELRVRRRSAGLVPGASHRAHSLHSAYWWLRCAVGPTERHEQGRRRLMEAPRMGHHQGPGRDSHRGPHPEPGPGSHSSSTRRSRRPMSRARGRGRVDARQLDATLDAIEHGPAAQRADPLVPWRSLRSLEPRRGSDGPGGRRAADRSRARYEWPVANQLENGAWHNYYLADGIEDLKLDTNVCAYVAAGVWHHFLLTRDRGFLEAMWPVVERALDFVLSMQKPRGEIIWARHADGTPWSYALLTGSSSICHSLRCAYATAGGGRGASRLGARHCEPRTSSHVRDAFEPKDRWAMDWYYPVLAGVVTGLGQQPRLRSAGARS